MRLWLGGYSADMAGTATGIGVLRAGDPDTGSAGGPLAVTGDAVAATSPSWVAAHPRLDVLYAALESAGTVQAYRRTGEETLAPLGPPVAAGDAVCHVAVGPDGGWLVASCWGDGRVVRMPLDAAGGLGAPAVAEAAVDPYSVALGDGLGGLGAPPVAVTTTGEERDPHAHQAVFLPGGLVATTDMGFDLVRFWRPESGRLRAAQQVVLPAGSGPRHAVWHPSGHLYVVTELSGEVFALAPDRTGRWGVVGGVSLGGMPGDTAAEIALSRDAEYVYAALRGSNTIATVKVRGSGDALAPVALTEAGVDWPRHHLVVRDTLLVAGQRSNDVVALTLDVRAGAPGRPVRRAEAPAPTCLLPAR